MPTICLNAYATQSNKPVPDCDVYVQTSADLPGGIYLSVTGENTASKPAHAAVRLSVAEAEAIIVELQKAVQASGRIAERRKLRDELAKARSEQSRLIAEVARIEAALRAL